MGSTWKNVSMWINMYWHKIYSKCFTVTFMNGSHYSVFCHSINRHCGKIWQLLHLHWHFWSQADQRIKTFSTWKCQWSMFMWKKVYQDYILVPSSLFSFQPYLHLIHTDPCSSAGTGEDERFTDHIAQDKPSIGGGGGKGIMERI